MESGNSVHAELDVCGCRRERGKGKNRLTVWEGGFSLGSVTDSGAASVRPATSLLFDRLRCVKSLKSTNLDLVARRMDAVLPRLAGIVVAPVVGADQGRVEEVGERWGGSGHSSETGDGLALTLRVKVVAHGLAEKAS